MKTLVCAMCLLLASGHVAAQVKVDADDVIFDRFSSQLLIDYSQTHDMLGLGQGISVKIFADARIQIELPSINPRAGLYEMTLGASELDALVVDIIESNLEPELPASSSELTYISDSTRTRIVLHASGFSTQSGATTRLAGPLLISEVDLGTSVTRNARSAGGRRHRLNLVEQKLLELTNDSRLRRI